MEKFVHMLYAYTWEKIKTKKILSYGLILIIGLLSLLIPLVLLTKQILQTHANAVGVHVFLTTADGKNNLIQQQDQELLPNATTNPLTITVDDTKPYQQIVGIGATITDTASYLLAKSTHKDEIIQKLFDPLGGIGISFLREPIGSTDFTPGAPYSFDDTPGDTSLTNFSLAPQQTTYPVIPLIQQALLLNPAIRVEANVWSPPAWMKTNNAFCNGYKCVHGALKSDDYDVYARYLVKYMQLMQQNNIPIYALTPQNEPNQITDYSGMDFAASDQENFVQNFLLPEFKTNHIHPQIWIHDWNYNSNPSAPNQNYAGTIAAFKPLADIVDGTAVHAYQSPIPNVNQGIGDLYQDEAADGLGDWAGTPSNIFIGIDMMIGYLRNGAKLVTKWGIVEDQTNGPRYNNQGWCGNNCVPLITLNTTTDTYSLNHDYYSLGHLSKFVKPGANRIDSTDISGSNIQSVAFKNPDGSKVLVAHNDASYSQAFAIAYHGQSFTYVLPSQALVTFVWDQDSNPTPPISLQSLSKKWYFAEGANLPNQNVYFTLFNASSTQAKATFTYYTTAGTVTKMHVIPPLSPLTIYATDEQLNSGNFSTVITSDQPIVATRQEYFSYTGSNTNNLFNVNGANATTGTSITSPTWYFSEGATVTNVNEWLVLFNPNSTSGQATITYYMNGTTLNKTVSLPGQQPVSIFVNNPTSGVGYGKDVSAIIHAVDSSSNPLPIVAERVMYAIHTIGSTSVPGGDATMGAVGLSPIFYFPEGYTGGNTSENLSLFNPGPQTTATITYYYQCCGIQPLVASPKIVTKTIILSANSKTLENVTADAGSNYWVSIQVNAASPILVERPMEFIYSNATGRVSHGTVNKQITGMHSLVGSYLPSTTLVFPLGETKIDWQQYISLENPQPTDAHAQVTYYTAGGTQFSYWLTVSKMSRQTISVHLPSTQQSVGGLGLNADTGGVSVIVLSDIPLLGESTMYMISPNLNFSSSLQNIVISGGYSLMGIPSGTANILPSITIIPTNPPTPTLAPTPTLIPITIHPTSQPTPLPTSIPSVTQSPTQPIVTPSTIPAFTPSNTPSDSSGINPPISPPASPTAQSLLGDINGDGFIDILDYNILAGCYGKSTSSQASCISSDLNNDGVVNGVDYNIFLRALIQQNIQ